MFVGSGGIRKDDRYQESIQHLAAEGASAYRAGVEGKTEQRQRAEKGVESEGDPPSFRRLGSEKDGCQRDVEQIANWGSDANECVGLEESKREAVADSDQSDCGKVGFKEHATKQDGQSG